MLDVEPTPALPFERQKNKKLKKASANMMSTSVMMVVGLATAVTVDVDLGKSTHVVNPLYLGCHSDTGYVQTARALFSQIIGDESFVSLR